MLQKSALFTCLILLLAFTAKAQQKVKISGKVTDAVTNEELVGATVLLPDGKGAVSDIDGFYQLEVAPGTYTLTIRYIGYITETREVKAASKVKLDIALKPDEQIIDEFQVIGDLAKPRETPIAYFNVGQKKIAEELGARDLPMVLNTTPGVYATQQGGAAGDARITIRGFNQRNVAVMIDGIPVNDMENGWVYWSNWYGLSDVTRVMQVQRGIGVSKIANPAVGGTINIMTKGIDQKAQYSASTEVGNNGYLKVGIAGNTGMLKGGWGVTFALSRRVSNGYVDALYDEMYSYFVKVDKKFKRHTLSFTALGSPQSHGQRAFKVRMSVYDTAYAEKYDADTSVSVPGRNEGIRYNQHWGYLDRATIVDPDGIRANGNEDTIYHGREIQNEKENYFHKPQFYLKHNWEISRKSFLTTTAYVSIGKGGGTSSQSVPQDPATGQFNFQSAYFANIYGNAFYSPINYTYDSVLHQSSGFIYSNVNNHKWLGLLSTFNHSFNRKLNLSGGIDVRHYRGMHYREVYDLLGGDYVINFGNKNQTSPVKKKGDKIEFNNDAVVNWGGIFAEAEYKTTRYSTFINLTTSYSGYQRIDYFLPRDTVTGKYSESPVKNYPGYTIKTGYNYNINHRLNAFANFGWLDRAPRFSNVFDRNNQVVQDVKNEKVASFEMGSGYRSRWFTINVNAYYTNWLNKPADFLPSYVDNDGNRFSYNINGMRAVHKGVEIDFIYKILPNLDFEGAVALADWRWKSGDTVQVTDEIGQPIPGARFYFSAKNVHVGDAAQTQVSAQLRWEPTPRFYIKPSATYFGRNYADFDPTALKGAYADKDSWRIPDYVLFNVHFGYSWKVGKVDLNLYGSILNLLNTIYVSDAQHRVTDSSNPGPAFDPRNVEVFFGPGRTWNGGLRVTF